MWQDVKSSRRGRNLSSQTHASDPKTRKPAQKSPSILAVTKPLHDPPQKPQPAEMASVPAPDTPGGVVKWLQFRVSGCTFECPNIYQLVKPIGKGGERCILHSQGCRTRTLQDREGLPRGSGAACARCQRHGGPHLTTCSSCSHCSMPLHLPLAPNVSLSSSMPGACAIAFAPGTVCHPAHALLPLNFLHRCCLQPMASCALPSTPAPTSRSGCREWLAGGSAASAHVAQQGREATASLLPRHAPLRRLLQPCRTARELSEEASVARTACCRWLSRRSATSSPTRWTRAARCGRSRRAAGAGPPLTARTPTEVSAGAGAAQGGLSPARCTRRATADTRSQPGLWLWLVPGWAWGSSGRVKPPGVGRLRARYGTRGAAVRPTLPSCGASCRSCGTCVATATSSR